MLAATMLFSSCTKDEESFTAPTIAFPNGTKTLEFTGIESIDIIVKIKAEAKIASLQYSNETGIFPFNDAIGKSDYEFNFKVSTADLAIAMEGKELLVYTFTLLDKDNNSRVSTFSITQELVTNLSTEKTNGVIGNLIGSEMGAWDLVADIGKASSDDAADKDMINTTILESTATGTFEVEWEAGNTTMFVKVNEDYASITTEEMAKDLYLDEAPVTKVSNVAVGDLYIAKIRGTKAYTVLEVTGVMVTDDNHEDKIEFKYKKK